MDEPKGGPIRTLLVAAVVAAAAGLAVNASHDFSKDRIAANDRARLVRSLNSVLGPSLSGRDLRMVRLAATDAELLGTAEAVDMFVAMDAGQPVAAIFASVAPDGYNAAIHMVVGVSAGGAITGVRVVSHRETPGLGDGIDVAKSPWITRFDGSSLDMPARELWMVDKDEGAFDSLAGATVTSRAMVQEVKNTLLYFEQHRDDLFRQAAASAPSDDATAD